VRTRSASTHVEHPLNASLPTPRRSRSEAFAPALRIEHPLSLDRLTSEDAAILGLESPTIAGHTCKLLVLGAPSGPRPTVADLREHVAARLGAAPRLRRRIVSTPLHLAPPAWIDDADFDLARHVRRLATGNAPVDPERLRALAAREMESRLDRAHPLWSLDVVEELQDGGTALLWKVHHALADGSEVMRLAEALLWDEGPAPRPAGAPEPSPGTLGLVTAALRARAGELAGEAGAAARGALSPRSWRAAASEVRRLPGAVVRDLRPARGPSPFDARAGVRREVAFAAVALDTLKRAGHAQPEHATVNDVLLGLVTGALRRWVSHHGGEPHRINAKIPVSLHDRHAHPEALANRDSFLCVGLPLAEPDPLVRIRTIAAQTRQRKREHDAQTLDALFREARHLPRPVSRLASRVSSGPGVFALNVSNVPGPAEARHVLGAPVTGMWSLAEIGQRHALRIAAISLAGTLYLGLTADAAAVTDVTVIADGLAAEAAELQDASS
jgi:diacylglycerol O-acyltransferase